VHACQHPFSEPDAHEVTVAAGSVVDGRTVEDVALGGVPKTVLADRMGCLKAGVAANVVVPTADYVRFATHYGFRPDFCEGGDPESKGIVEALVGYAKRDLVVPARAKTAEEKRFLALGEVAVAVLTGAAAA
jgi:hypothetical protein